MYVLVYVLECIRQLRFSQGRMFIKVKEHIHCAYMKYKRKMTNIRMQRRHKKVKQHTCVEWVHWTLTSASLVGCWTPFRLFRIFPSHSLPHSQVSDSLSTETAPDLHVTATHSIVFIPTTVLGMWYKCTWVWMSSLPLSL